MLDRRFRGIAERIIDPRAFADDSHHMGLLSSTSDMPVDLVPAEGKGTPGEPFRKRPLVQVLLAVAVIALAVEGFMLSSSRLYALADSGGYIALAGGIAERLDFSDEYFQFRLPGYPVMLAAIFRVFGSASPLAILAIQHAMVVAITILTTLLAWTLWPNRAFAAITGMFCALSMHLSAMASAIMTEAPYTLVLTLCVVLLVRYHRIGGWRRLAWASAFAGLCTVTKAVGQAMPVLCIVVGMHRAWIMRRQSVAAIRWGGLRSVALASLCAIGPAALFVLPVMYNNYRIGGRFQLSCNLGLHLYFRATFVEGFDTGPTTSEAVTMVRETRAEARRRELPTRSEPGDPFGVTDAFRLLHGMSMAEAADVMGQAGRDLLVQNLGTVLVRGVHHTYRTLVMPDVYYRFVPGERPEKMCQPLEVASWISQRAGETMDRYLPLKDTPTATSPLRGRMTRWYHRYIDKGPPVFGILDTPYEEFILLCALGGLLSLTRSDRMTWFIPGMVVFFHVVCQSYLGGVWPRYAVPIHPVMHIFGAFILVRLGKAALAMQRALVSRRVLRHASAACA